jgi:hypothetical protein
MVVDEQDSRREQLGVFDCVAQIGLPGPTSLPAPLVEA